MADCRGTLSMAVAYRGLGLGLAINPAKLAGSSVSLATHYGKSSTGKKSGQRAMLSVVNPAVVAIDTTWKNAWLIVISAEL